MEAAFSLTPREAQCLALIEASVRDSGVCPSFEELMIGLGLNSKAGVHRLITQLESKGRIERLRYRKRALKVIAPLRKRDARKPVDRAALAAALRRAAARLEAA